MKPFIDIENFTAYLNQGHIVNKTIEVTTVSASGKDFTAFLIMKANKITRKISLLSSCLNLSIKRIIRKERFYRRNLR